LVVGKFNKEFQTIFEGKKTGKYYQDEVMRLTIKLEHPIPMHLMERFICLQAQKIASAGSLFASGCRK
jgi:hypothetical protein